MSDAPGPLAERLATAATALATRLGATALPRPLESYDDPLAELRRARASLPEGGRLVVAMANGATADSVVLHLRSDPAQASYAQPGPGQVLGYATGFKLLLEAGFSPDIVETLAGEVDPALLDAATPLLQHLRVDVARAAHHLGAEGYLFIADPVADLPETGAEGVRHQRPVTFVACVNDDLQLAHNLLASPVFGPDSPHQLLTYRGMTSAAEGLNRGLHEAEHDLVVMIQQDIYVPSWWPERLARQWDLASAGGQPPSLAGPFGVRYREGGREHVGHVVDRDHLLRMPRELPARVDGLDELVLIVPRDTPLRVEPRVGWHLYGTDLALSVHEAGGWTAVLDLPCHHNTLYHQLDESYRHSEAMLATKWPRELPVVTNTSTIEEDPRDARVRDLEAFVARGHEEHVRMSEAIDVARVEIDRLHRELAHATEQIALTRERNAKLRSRLRES